MFKLSSSTLFFALNSHYIPLRRKNIKIMVFFQLLDLSQDGIGRILTPDTRPMAANIVMIDEPP